VIPYKYREQDMDESSSSRNDFLKNRRDTIEHYYRRILSNSLREKIGIHLRLMNASGILRRYFVMNGFDGILTVFGIILGSYMSGTIDARIIVYASIGASLAMAVSGFSGALLTERAERLREIKDLEESMFMDLGGSILERAVNTTTILAAAIDATAPLLFSLISVSPFILTMYGMLHPELALGLSIVIIGVSLFSLGVFLARLSEENILKYGILMLLSGLIVGLLTVVLLNVVGGG